MRLTARLIAYVLLGVVIFLGIDGWLVYREETRVARADLDRELLSIGRILRTPILEIATSSGLRAAQDAISARVDPESHLDIRLVDFTAPSQSGLPAPVLALQDFSPAERERFERNDETTIRTRDGDAREQQLAYVRVDTKDSGTIALELLATENARVEKVRGNAWEHIVELTLGMFILGTLAASWLGVRLVGRPLRAFIERTRELGAGRFLPTKAIAASDEWIDLERALDQTGAELQASSERLGVETAKRIETLEQLRHADRLKTVGQLASGLAHELGTPLNVVVGRAALIESGGLAAEDVRKSAEIIHAQTKRMTALVRQLLDFARRGSPRRSHFDLGDVIRRACELVRSLDNKARIELSVPAVPCSIDADPAQCEQMLTNLLVNAQHAMPLGGTIRVKLESVPGGVQIEVKDEGVGIDEAALPRIFDPFFTTKDVGKGTGLGLAVVHGIVTDHGGSIVVESAVGRGSTFRIFLPEGAR